MAIAVRATASQTDGSDIGTEPTGAAQNDLLIMIIANPFSGTAFTPPTGWTEIIDFQYNSTFCRMGAFWIIRGASAPSYDIAGGNGSSTGVWTYAITGHDATTPMDVAAASATKSGTNPDSPTVTIATDQAMVIVATSNDAANQAITAPTGFTELTQSTAGSTSAYKTGFSTGATGALSWTSATQEWGSLTIAIRPAGGAAALRRYSLTTIGVG